MASQDKKAKQERKANGRTHLMDSGQESVAEASIEGTVSKSESGKVTESGQPSLKAIIGQYIASMTLKFPASWEQLPDIGLYMDQVITYLERQLSAFRNSDDEYPITPSMINNYAKAKLIPRTDGKKYGQSHIALLLAIFSLKRVLSVQDILALFEGLDDDAALRAFYELFRAKMSESAERTANELKAALLSGLTEGQAPSSDGALLGANFPDGSEGSKVSDVSDQDRKRIQELALQLAVDASVQSFAAEKLLSIAKQAGQKNEQKGSQKGEKADKGEKKE